MQWQNWMGECMFAWTGRLVEQYAVVHTRCVHVDVVAVVTVVVLCIQHTEMNVRTQFKA